MRDALRRIVGLFAFVLVCSVCSAAQSTVKSREADHAALRALLTNITQAINDQKFDELSNYFTKDFAFTTVDQTVVTTVPDLKIYYQKLTSEGPITDAKIAPKADALSRFTGTNTAYCYGTSDDTYRLRRNGRTIHMASRWTATLEKEDGQWKVAAVHAGVNPLDNPVLKVRTMPLWRKMLLAIGVGKYPGEK